MAEWTSADGDVPDAIVITGPTATGKTRLAIEVAEHVGTAIISMDSRQVYRGMDIGTAKPSWNDRRGVEHFGFDLVDPDARYSAGRFAADARAWIADIRSRGTIPLLAGGTGFFLRALTHPMFDEPKLDQERRDALRALLETRDADSLQQWVQALEPGQTTDAWRGGGRQRLARRIEVAVLTGRPLSWWQQNAPSGKTPLRPLVFVLEAHRPALVETIDRRVLDMVEAGLPDEVHRLVQAGYGPADPGMNATGYAEFLPFVDGARSLEQAVELTQVATRRYARRQVTWFRNQLPDAVRLDAAKPVAELRDTILRHMKGVGS
jgi:tRNA dimethylallyltransferase